MPISSGGTVPLTHPADVSVATPIGSTRYAGTVFTTKGMKLKVVAEGFGHSDILRPFYAQERPENTVC